MNRLSPFLLLFLYLFTATEFRQLLKCKTLFEHYAEHKDKNSDLSFNDFLYMHYLGDDANPYDDKQDEELPFKSGLNSASLNVIPAPPVQSLDLKVQSLHLKYNFSRDSKILLSYHPPIWQPPKIS